MDFLGILLWSLHQFASAMSVSLLGSFIRSTSLPLLSPFSFPSLKSFAWILDLCGVSGTSQGREKSTTGFPSDLCLIFRPKVRDELLLHHLYQHFCPVFSSTSSPSVPSEESKALKMNGNPLMSFLSFLPLPSYFPSTSLQDFPRWVAMLLILLILGTQALVSILFPLEFLFLPSFHVQGFCHPLLSTFLPSSSSADELVYFWRVWVPLQISSPPFIT